MSKGLDNKDENSRMRESFGLQGVRKEAPRSVIILLLLIYLASTVIISVTAGSQRVVEVGDSYVFLYTFAGIFSSICNLCVILMVIFGGKIGFVWSVTALLVQIPMNLLGIIVKHNYTSLPGVVGNILTVIVVIAIYRSNKKMDAYQKRILEQATTDILTGLPNRFAGRELVYDLIGRKRPFAAVAININGFKSINDTMGFDLGNKVLVEVARRWKEIADKGLTGTRDYVTRINGDEFAIIIRDYEKEDDVLSTIKYYEEALGGTMSIDGYDFFVRASFGYAFFPTDSDKKDTLLSCAVTAMKEIKRLGTGEHILRYTPDLNNEQDLLFKEKKLRDAIAEDRVFAVFQPQFDMSHKLRGFEALARITNSDGDVVSPAKFVPIAERVGLIGRIDLTVYRKATEFFGDLLKKTGADITLSLNVSVKHLMKSGFVEEIQGLIKDSGIPADHLEIEITESIMIESTEKAAARLDELKKKGIRIAIDDFGTGYSSLSYLNSFPADILKIDKSFIDMMNTGESSKKYVEAIISLAHVLGYSVVAEGVEYEDQLETLRGIDCDYIQGYIWGRPLPKEEAEKLVTE